MDQALIDVPVPVVTPRLVLRPSMDGDIQAVFEAARESHEDLFRWQTWAWRHGSVEIKDYEGFLAQKQARFLTREQLVFLAFDRRSSQFIGSASLNDCDWENRNFTLGYWTRSSKAGQGYATEAGVALCRYAFNVLGAKRILSFHAEGNDASEGVLKKIGFTKDGVLPGQHMLHDQAVDEHQYYLLDEKRLPPLEIKWS
jgi:RimJ/RimL family protein N-acetyltransferase